MVRGEKAAKELAAGDSAAVEKRRGAVGVPTLKLGTSRIACGSERPCSSVLRRSTSSALSPSHS